MKVIALDVDGVLLNFTPAFDIAAEIVLGRKLPINKDEYQMDHYHLAKRIGATNEDVEKIFTYMIETRMYSNLEPLEGVKEALQAIREAGFKICLVTALAEEAKEQRLENLKNKLDFVPDEIHCVGMGLSKADKLRQVKPDVFADDRLQYLECAPEIYHLVWVDQKESQDNKDSMVDVHVHSLKEWTDNHMPRVVKKLNHFYEDKMPVQIDLKLENHTRHYGKIPEKEIQQKPKVKFK